MKSSSPKRPGCSRARNARPCRHRLSACSVRLNGERTRSQASSKRMDTWMRRRSCGRITRPQSLWNSTTVILPHGSSKSTESSSPSRRRLKKRASERSSGIWRRRSNAGTTHGCSRHALAATIMTEDAKTEKYTARSPCGAYIETIKGENHQLYM